MGLAVQKAYNCFAPFLWRRNGVFQQVMFVCLFVRTYVRPSRNVRLCTGNKMAGPRGAIFCIHMQDEKVHSHANFHPNRQRLDLHFQGQRFASSTLGSSNMIIVQTVTDRSNIAIANI